MVGELSAAGGESNGMGAGASFQPVLGIDSSVDLAKESLPKPVETGFTKAKVQLVSAAKMLTHIARESARDIAQELVPSTDSVIERLDKSVSLIEALDNCLKGYQGIASADCGRTPKVTLQLKDAVREFRLFYDGYLSATRNRGGLQREQDLFARVIEQNFRNGADEQQQDALAILNRLLGPRAMQGKFPTAEGYIPLSPTLKQELAEPLKKLDQLREQEIELKSKISQASRRNAESDSGGATDTELENLQVKIGRVKDGIRAAVERATDIDLTKDEAGLLNSLEFNIQLKPQVLETLYTVSKAVISAIRDVIEDLSDRPRTTIPLLTMKTDGEGARQRLVLSTAEIEFTRPSDYHESSRYLSSLMQYYLSVREVLSDAFRAYSAERPADVRLRGWLDPLRSDLSTPFGASGGDAILAELIKRDDALFASAKQRLTDVQIYRVASGDVPQAAFLMPEYLGVFRELIQRALAAPDREFFDMVNQWRNQGIEGQLEALPFIRHLAQKQRHKELATLIDRELVAVSANTLSSSHIRQSALIFALEYLSMNDELSHVLKNTLTCREKVRVIEGQLARSFGKGPASTLLGHTVTEISRRFNPTLSDYLGYPELVTKVRELLDGNSLLLQEPRRYGGMQPKLAIWNAILLFGPPGVGKSFLIECIANEYGLELVQISREEMERDARETPKIPARGGRRSTAFEPLEPAVDTKSLTTHLTDYLNAKIQGLRSKIKETGAKGGIIFIDELEAEFRKRHSGMTSDDVERTNIMLRVIESAIAKNPDILFAAATNFIGMLDAAAKRFGRFGIIFELTLVTKEAAKAMVLDTATRLFIDPDTLSQAKGFSELTDEAVNTTPLMLLSALVRAYALRPAESAPQDADEIVRLFRAMLKKVKELTMFERGGGDAEEKQAPNAEIAAQ